MVSVLDQVGIRAVVDGVRRRREASMMKEMKEGKVVHMRWSRTERSEINSAGAAGFDPDGGPSRGQH